MSHYAIPYASPDDALDHLSEVADGIAEWVHSSGNQSHLMRSQHCTGGPDCTEGGCECPDACHICSTPLAGGQRLRGISATTRDVVVEFEMCPRCADWVTATTRHHLGDRAAWIRSGVERLEDLANGGEAR